MLDLRRQEGNGERETNKRCNAREDKESDKRGTNKRCIEGSTKERCECERK